jgi:hypothetical protein
LDFDHVRGRNDFSLGNCQALYPFHHRQKTKRDRIKKLIEKRLVVEEEKKSPVKSTKTSTQKLVKKHIKKTVRKTSSRNR